jgi:hypothetical protein
MEENVISMQEIFTFEKKGIGQDGRVIGVFKPTRIRPRFLERLRVSGMCCRPACSSGNAGWLRRKEGSKMGLIIGLVFVGVFTLIALPLAAMGPSSNAKQALATLDSALKVDRRELLQQKLNVRKNELLSSIPWLNQKLLKFELTPYLRKMLSQADLDWSAGRLLLMRGGSCSRLTRFWRRPATPCWRSRRAQCWACFRSPL